MREKWKLCMISGGVLVFAVLGTLILLNHTMSSADDRVKEFTAMQAVSGGSVSGQAASGEGVSGEAATGSSVSGAAGTGIGETAATPKPEDLSSTESKEKSEKSGESVPTGTEKPYYKNVEKQEEEPDDFSMSFSAVAEEPEGFSFGETNPPDPLGVQIANYAMGFQGVRYVYGGTDLPEQSTAWSSDRDARKKEFDGDFWGDGYGVDCSGLVMRVFERFDIKLPRSVKEQAEAGKEVKLKDIEPGDIVFYGANNTTVTHCGIYVGNGLVIHVSAQTERVVMEDMNYRRIAKVKRVVGE